MLYTVIFDEESNSEAIFEILSQRGVKMTHKGDFWTSKACIPTGCTAKCSELNIFKWHYIPRRLTTHVMASGMDRGVKMTRKGVFGIQRPVYPYDAHQNAQNWIFSSDITFLEG